MDGCIFELDNVIRRKPWRDPGLYGKIPESKEEKKRSDSPLFFSNDLKEQNSRSENGEAPNRYPLTRKMTPCPYSDHQENQKGDYRPKIDTGHDYWVG